MGTGHYADDRRLVGIQGTNVMIGRLCGDRTLCNDRTLVRGRDTCVGTTQFVGKDIV